MKNYLKSMGKNLDLACICSDPFQLNELTAVILNFLNYRGYNPFK